MSTSITRALAVALVTACTACAGEPLPPPPLSPPVAVPANDPTRAVVEGVIHGPEGAAVDGALVAVVSATGRARREAARGVSEGGGRFRFAGLPPGSYAVTATAPGLTAAYVDAFAVEAGQVKAGVEANLGGEGRVVRGVVVGPLKQPVAGAVLRFERASKVKGDLFLALTDARGAYEVRLPGVVYYSLQIEAPGLEAPVLGLQGAAGEQTVDVALTRAFPPAEPPPAEVRAWLKQATVPLATVEPGHGVADLAPVLAMVGAARVVALGEAGHGVREFFQLKHRMLEALVVERGFTALGFEASFAEALAVDAYVRTGKGDPALAVAGMRFWTWDTEEVLALVRWMRRYNEDPKHPQKLRFYGFDMQFPSGSARALTAYFRRVDPAFEPEARRALVLVDDDFTLSLYEHLPSAARGASDAAVAALGKRLDERREAYVKRAGAEAFALARLHAAVIRQGARMLALPLETGIPARDEAMAENVRALLDLMGPSGKIVLSAENGHVGREASWFGAGMYRPMGSHLAQALGDAMVVFGFAKGEGSFQAMDMGPKGAGVRDFTVPTAPPGTLDGALASLDPPLLALDMRPAPREGAVAEWLGARLPTRDNGCCFSDAMTEDMLSPLTPRGAYDALFFVRKTSAARPNPGARPPPRAPQAPTEPALRNGGMEEGPPGELPAGWQAGYSGTRGAYQVLASTDRPREGRRSALIARERSPWPWGQGQLVQEIDAAPLRGKRVRLRAALRAEVEGVGNEAHLFMSVADGRGDRTLAVAGTFDRPIVDRAFRTYDVEVDVPPEAGTLLLGAALSGNGRVFVDEVSLEAIGDAK